MALAYKLDVMKALKKKGYSSYRIRKEKLLRQETLQAFRHNRVVLSAPVIETLCELLECQPGDIIKYVPEKKKFNFKYY